jgi:hypothetical protein
MTKLYQLRSSNQDGRSRQNFFEEGVEWNTPRSGHGEMGRQFEACLKKILLQK